MPRPRPAPVATAAQRRRGTIDSQGLPQPRPRLNVSGRNPPCPSAWMSQGGSVPERLLERWSRASARSRKSSNRPGSRFRVRLAASAGSASTAVSTSAGTVAGLHRQVLELGGVLLSFGIFILFVSTVTVVSRHPWKTRFRGKLSSILLASRSGRPATPQDASCVLFGFFRVALFLQGQGGFLLGLFLAFSFFRHGGVSRWWS